jgi:hypothetical protein
LGVYLLRTALYLDAVESGHPHFDLVKAAAATGHDEVQGACALRRATEFRSADLALVARAVDLVLDCKRGRRFRSAEELQRRALALSTVSPHASALLVNVLFGAGEVDYVALALAPW